MPMMKDYTLFYFIHAYSREQFAPVEFNLNRPLEDGAESEISEALFSPSENSVQEILNFSKSYEVLNSKLTKSIEVIKN
jgi:hypothetical protein